MLLQMHHVLMFREPASFTFAMICVCSLTDLSLALQGMQWMTPLWLRHTQSGFWQSMAGTRSCASLRETTTVSAPDPFTPKCSCSSTSVCNARTCSYLMNRTPANLSWRLGMQKGGDLFPCCRPSTALLSVPWYTLSGWSGGVQFSPSFV